MTPKMKLLLTGMVAALFIVTGCLMAAQTNQSPATPPKSDRPESIRVNVELVNVAFSARDKKGKLVNDLSKEDFKIFENSVEQNATNFSRETDLPLAVALLIDASASIREKLAFEQEATIDFFHSTLRRKVDRGLLVSFDVAIDILQDFSDNPDLFTKAVRKIKPGGGTKMFDAIYLACQEKLKNDPAPRKALILISDGDDNNSNQDINTVIDIARRADTSIYAISTNSSGFFGMESPKLDKVLKTLADETGGQALFPMKAADLGKSFLDISQELRSQYSLGYRSTNPAKDGSFRSIRIECARKDIRIKTRKGYYAQKG
jgi:Ca-activated chloride channel family protein